MLWWLKGLAEDHKFGFFVETWLGGGYTECCDATGVC